MVVLDTSAVLAVLLNEPGADAVVPHMAGAEISIINWCEVLTITADQGGDVDAVAAVLASYRLRVRAFKEVHAVEVAKLRPATKHLGLGLGDRACLVQAKISDIPVLTADRKWAQLDLGLDIRLIR